MMMNPILRNEIKTDSRRFRFYVLLMLYVALLGVPTLLIYFSITDGERIDASNFIALYTFLACMQAAILMFIVPALTANSITGEREKQSLDILLTTKMSTRSIIIGKLLGAVSKVILLIICTMPVYAIVLFLGGIKMQHIIGCNLYLMMTAIFVASMCIWVSTMVKTSKFANVASYALELGFILGYPIGLVVWMVLSGITDEITNQQSAQVMLERVMHALCVSPAVGYGHLLSNQLTGRDVLFNMFGGNVKMIMPGWLISVIVEVILTVVFVEAAVKRLNPHKKKHARRTEKTAKVS